MSTTEFNSILGLVNERRLRASTQGNRGILVASESDKGRVINSASFRRLQQKAQVFPLEANAAVRTRLTHSIEVAQIGRHLTQNVIALCGHSNGDYESLAALVNTVETACLLHDVGNPPFGHLGEAAIREWFKEFSQKFSIEDLSNFDGNPQGFRIVSFLAGADCFGLNLTCTLLLSTIKYPWDLSRKPEGKKNGIFASELENYVNACEAVNWAPHKKFPFMRLMNAADEIAYSMSDLEDGLEKGIITMADLKSDFGADLFPSGALKPFIAFKTNVINRAVSLAAENFTQGLDGILGGEDLELLPIGTEVGELLSKVSRFARKRIYSDASAERVELAGRSVIKGLLNHFGQLIEISEEDFTVLISNDESKIRKNNLDFHIRLFRRLPESYCKKYGDKKNIPEIQRRAQLIVDSISGMTDDYALEMYQMLEGVRIK